VLIPCTPRGMSAPAAWVGHHVATRALQRLISRYGRGFNGSKESRTRRHSGQARGGKLVMVERAEKPVLSLTKLLGLTDLPLLPARDSPQYPWIRPRGKAQATRCRIGWQTGWQSSCLSPVAGLRCLALSPHWWITLAHGCHSPAFPRNALLLSGRQALQAAEDRSPMRFQANCAWRARGVTSLDALRDGMFHNGGD
jgi:hypothetical protein